MKLNILKAARDTNEGKIVEITKKFRRNQCTETKGEEKSFGSWLPLVPNIRNSGAAKIVDGLLEKNLIVDIDPYVNWKDVSRNKYQNALYRT